MTRALGQNARAKVAAEGLWPAKAAGLCALYGALVAPKQGQPYPPG
jgi:hypothetical protein